MTDKNNNSYRDITKNMQGYNFNNHLIALKVSPILESNITDVESNFFSSNNLMMFILILSGKMEITLDYKKHSFNKNYWVEITSKSSISNVTLSKDFFAYIILFSGDFVVDTLLDKKPLPISHFIDIKETPGLLLMENDVISMKYSMDRIFFYIKQENHNYKKEMLHNTFYNLILEVSNIFINSNNQRKEERLHSRKENILHKFVSLVTLHAKKEHSPNFYAQELCMSAQYLSMILKEATGEPATYWINKALIREAKSLLRTPGYTIAQVSEELGFSDQSSFGKFFKKHANISPKKYVEENTILRL